MLKATNLSFRYKGEDWLFRNLNLEVNPGEVVGIFGKSGSGKTTMGKILAGYLDADDGTVEIDGKPVYPLKRTINPIQLIWQHPEKAINPRWRMKKVLAENEKADRAFIEQFELKEEWMTRYPGELSGGELQRFCLARAFGSSTQYIIADEITTMLDALNQAKIWKIIQRQITLRKFGLLVISHDLALLKRISDRIIDFKALTHVANKIAEPTAQYTSSNL